MWLLYLFEWNETRFHRAVTILKRLCDRIRGGMSAATFGMSAERRCAADGRSAGGACVRTSPAHGSLAELTLAAVHDVQTPKAKWTYLRVAAGTGRARYLNEPPGRSGARRGRGQPAWLRRPRPRPPAPLSWALISPGRAIQLGVARCISRGCLAAARPARPDARTPLQMAALLSAFEHS